MIRIGLLAILLAFAPTGEARAQVDACTQVANGATTDITAFSVCKKVTNASGLPLCAVSQVDSTQWASFYNNPPSGVTIADCVSVSCSTNNLYTLSLLSSSPASNYTGLKVTASSNGSRIYIAHNREVRRSLDSGASWSTVYTFPISGGFIQAIATSSDGTKLIAALSNGSTADYIFTSTDSGATWTQRTGAGLRVWADVAMSSDGTKLVAIGTWGDTNVAVSTDSGSSWSVTSVVIDSAGEWRGRVGMSGDGNVIVFSKNNTSQKVAVSTNGGSSWTTRTVYADGMTVYGIALSNDGTKIALGGTGQYLIAGTYAGAAAFVSSNSGSSWTLRDLSGTIYHPVEGGFSSSVSDVAMSSDGARIMVSDAGGNTGNLYVSSNMGASWVVQQYIADRRYQSADLSADGSVLYANANNYGIYRGACGVDCTAPWGTVYAHGTTNQMISRWTTNSACSAGTGAPLCGGVRGYVTCSSGTLTCTTTYYGTIACASLTATSCSGSNCGGGTCPLC